MLFIFDEVVDDKGHRSLWFSVKECHGFINTLRGSVENPVGPDLEVRCIPVDGTSAALIAGFPRFITVLDLRSTGIHVARWTNPRVYRWKKWINGRPDAGGDGVTIVAAV